MARRIINKYNEYKNLIICSCWNKRGKKTNYIVFSCLIVFHKGICPVFGVSEPRNILDSVRPHDAHEGTINVIFKKFNTFLFKRHNIKNSPKSFKSQAKR